jgi:hypothetical protein
MKRWATTVVLGALLVLEVALVVLLRTLGWFETGNALQLVTCVVVNVLPLVAAVAMLAANGFRFGIRSLMIAITLVGVFLAVSLMPLLDYRSARRASIRLVSANATLNAGIDGDEFYTRIGLPPPPAIASSKGTNIPPWLTPLTRDISTIPPDDAVRSI